MYDLVNESQKANNGEIYRDIFVTAPTGSGKSVMFQIPAIYLAEKYNKMTIGISFKGYLTLNQKCGILYIVFGRGRMPASSFSMSKR